ncbi:serine hydrolase [soil metagenome]
MKPKRSVCLAASLLIVPPVFANEGLTDRLDPLLEAHEGDVAIVVEHLETGESFARRPDEPMPTASLIKLPVMVEAYRQARQDGLDLQQSVTLTDADKVPGAGILNRHFYEGATLPLRDAIRLMIVYSDNTATNLVLDVIGLPKTSETMESLGYPNTKIHSKVYRRDTSVFPERSERFGLGSTTAAEMVRLLRALQRGELAPPDDTAAMLDHLKACEDPNKFPRFLPSGAVAAMKTGSVDATRTAAGILNTPAGPVALCVLTDRNADQSWGPDNAGDLLCAEVARAVFHHFQEIATTTANPEP